MIADLGLSKIFWMHAAVMFIGNIFVFFAMPETRGLTMTELNEIFGGKVTYDKRNSYGDVKCTDELEEKLASNKNLEKQRSSVANIAASKAAATAALQTLRQRPMSVRRDMQICACGLGLRSGCQT